MKYLTLSSNNVLLFNHDKRDIKISVFKSPIKIDITYLRVSFSMFFHEGIGIEAEDVVLGLFLLTGTFL